MGLRALGIAALLFAAQEAHAGNGHSIIADDPPRTTPYYADVSNPDDLSPALIGGTVADPAQWPASPWIGNCSSTLLGPKVLLTAAHCVSNGGNVSFTLANQRFSGSCTHHADYRRNSTADWALCVLSAPVSGIQFESIATAAEAGCAVDKKFLWTGYGCQRWGGTLDGKFRTGLVATRSCPSGTNHDIVTRGSVALCSGDSGGSGYVVADNGDRKVVGVNSRSNTTDTSYVSNTVGIFRDWASTWATQKQVAICGITAGAPNCRGAGDPDPDPPGCDNELIAAINAQNAAGVALAQLQSCMASR